MIIMMYPNFKLKEKLTLSSLPPDSVILLILPATLDRNVYVSAYNTYLIQRMRFTFLNAEEGLCSQARRVH